MSVRRQKSHIRNTNHTCDLGNSLYSGAFGRDHDVGVSCIIDHTMLARSAVPRNLHCSRGIHIINYIIKSTRGYKQFAFWGDGHDIRNVGMTHTKVAAATATMAIDKALCWFGFSLRYICEMMKFPWIIMAWNGFCQALTAEFRTVLTAFPRFNFARITSLPIIGNLKTPASRCQNSKKKSIQG
ncbi:hypothetical protein ABKN59_008171 [Abortiporus biennis]